MNFLTPMLLGGIALVALPIVLHLVMRQEPQLHLFPALRFVRQRRDSNRRRVKLRHWLLLAMRCLLIALFALALARPTLKGSGLKGKEGAPLAVAAVVDNSLRMEYIRKNRTRLEEATEIAAKLVGKLPEESEVAVFDLGRASGGFARDLQAAQTRLSNLAASANTRPLADTIVEAISLVAEKEEYRQEVFVYTDFAAAAFSEENIAQINDAMAEEADVRLYLIDVGAEEPTNAELGDLEIRRTLLRPGEALHVEADVMRGGLSESPLVELWLENEAGELEKRGQQIAVAAGDDAAQTRAAFDVADLELGTHQGLLKLTATDPLAVDNVRYFTVEVRPPDRVLLLGEQDSDAVFVEQALNPTLWEQPLRFLCDVQTFADVPKIELQDYQAVLLLDPPPLSEDEWQALGQFASAGGGVGLFLGHNAQSAGMNGEAAQQLLPGLLKRKSRDATYLRPQRLDHPSLAGLKDYAETIPWQTCDVFAYWQLGEPAGDAYTIAQYANGDPAIIERSAGRGRVLTLTTPFSDPLSPEGRDPWNVLTAPARAWPFVALCDELTGYLAQDSIGELNYAAGNTARLPLGAQQQISSYVLRQPDGQSLRRTASPGDRSLLVSTTDQLGNYRLTAGGEAADRTARLDRGFSVNVSAEATTLTRIEPKTLVASLPKGRVETASSLDDVQEYVDIGRRGREIYAWVMVLVTAVWCGEHFLANRFYRSAS